MLYGTKLGQDSAANRLYYKRGDDTEEIMDKIWTSAAVRACLPDDIEVGEYELYISRPNASGELVESNKLDFTVPRFIFPGVHISD
jgi:hypothetical protein